MRDAHLRADEFLLKGSRRSVLLRAFVLILLIALLDWRIIGDIPLGFLYLLPMWMVGSVLEPWQIAPIAAGCTVLAEFFDDYPWNPSTGISRDVLYFAAFFGVAVFMREVTRKQKADVRHMQELERETEARRDAEEELRVLIESSPAAVLTAESTGTIVMANQAAHRMLNIEQGHLPGKSIYRYFASLQNVLHPEDSHQFFRSVMQAHGCRDDGEAFLADICFSTYRTNAGLRLAAMVLDSSEEFSTHEVASLRQLMLASRIAIGAVSHEIRNICGAIGVVHKNLAGSRLLDGNRDFETL